MFPRDALVYYYRHLSFNPLEIGSTLQIARIVYGFPISNHTRFQSPRNRVNTSNGGVSGRGGDAVCVCSFNPLEIGSTLQIHKDDNQ